MKRWQRSQGMLYYNLYLVTPGVAYSNTHHISVETWDEQKSPFHVPLPTTAPINSCSTYPRLWPKRQKISILIIKLPGERKEESKGWRVMCVFICVSAGEVIKLVLGALLLSNSWKASLNDNGNWLEISDLLSSCLNMHCISCQHIVICWNIHRWTRYAHRELIVYFLSFFLLGNTFYNKSEKRRATGI